MMGSLFRSRSYVFLFLVRDNIRMRCNNRTMVVYKCMPVSHSNIIIVSWCLL